MRRLYKNKKERKICGVCAGVADFLNCDPTLVRLITVGLLIFTFTIILWVYLIAAFIMPDKEQLLLP